MFEKENVMNITFENITIEEALNIIEFVSKSKKDELEKVAEKLTKTGNHKDLQEYLKKRKNFL